MRKAEKEKQKALKALQMATLKRVGDNFVKTVSSCLSNYKDYVALVGADDKIYLGKLSKYLFKAEHGWIGGYDNTEKDLIYVSDNHSLYYYMFGSGMTLSQSELIKQGIKTDDDFKEIARAKADILDGLEVTKE